MHHASQIRVALTVACVSLAAPVTAGPTVATDDARCLFVSSYHRGYAWSDGVERGLRATLGKRCAIRQFDMNTKRRKSKADIERSAVAALSIVREWSPDIIITADDNAAKYLVVPYLKHTATPVVFSGVNWTAREYGFPTGNVTGIVEVAPIEPMLRKALQVTRPEGVPRAFYLGAETLTERKNLRRFQHAAARLRITLEHRLAPDMKSWLAAYDTGQQHHFLVLGSNSGIGDWNDEAVRAALGKSSRRLSLTNHGWMMPFTMFGMTKIPEEHGEWSAKAAIAILDGTPLDQIPVVTNRRWDLWTNESLLAAAGIELPHALRARAKRTR